MSRFKSTLYTIASPHYYSGRSVTKLTLHRALEYLAYLRTEKPSPAALEEMKRLAGSGKGKVALVLGNGPSLNKLNTAAVANYCDDIYVVNGFFNLQMGQLVRPTHYCLSDPSYFYPKDDAHTLRIEELKNFIEKSNSVLVLPHTLATKGAFPNSKTLFFDDREKTLFSKNISPLRPRSYTSVTLYKALAVACHMEYDHIFILGLDNTEFYNYRGNLDNTTTMKQSAYSTTKEGVSYGEFDIHGLFVSGMAGRMQSYAHLFGDLRVFPKDKITNLDQNSLVDTFPKAHMHPLIRSD